MMREGLAPATEQLAEASPVVTNYRQGLLDGRVDALAEVLVILGSAPEAPGLYADLRREIGALYAGAVRRANE